MRRKRAEGGGLPDAESFAARYVSVLSLVARTTLFAPKAKARAYRLPSSTEALNHSEEDEAIMKTINKMRKQIIYDFSSMSSGLTTTVCLLYCY